jgi:Na+/H+-dicarboxylate symporters
LNVFLVFRQAVEELSKRNLFQERRRYYHEFYHFRDGTNTLGVIFFSLVFGSVLGTLPGDKKQSVIDFFQTVYETLLQMLLGTIW